MSAYFLYIVLILATIGLNIVAKRFLQQRWNLWLGCCVPALIMMLFLWKVSQPPDQYLFSDFNKAYYPAGRLIFQNPSELYLNSCVAGFVNIPIIGYLFTPFSLLNLQNAQILLVILSMAAVVLTCYLLLKLTNFSGWQRVVVIGLFVANGPLYYSIRDGNSTHFLLPLLLCVFFLLDKKRDIMIGIILAIAALIKIPLFLLGGYFFLRMRWRVVIAMIATVLAITGASVLIFGLDLHLTWFQQCIQPYAGKPVAAYNVQSVDGFLARLLTNDNLLNWNPLVLGWNFKVARYLLIAVLVGGTIWVGWRSKSPVTIKAENSEFSMAICLSLLISPISWTHYYLLLLLPLALYFGNRLAIPEKKVWFWLIVLSALLISLPVIRVDNYRPILQLIMSKIVISSYFFGGVLLLVILAIGRLQTAQKAKSLESESVS
ncbi:glycosyltransferase family 87 protein [Argonema galeatum]|uniref:glycosyltransferase family 87 protein n=1 Tax=Argonema galeatum TaxID=2942762 RepID=UPI002012995F|nr:glycosyltransferase family 87 protein [Argonema galeatum]MCL1465567.1 DUF2029 domain-containing protein [Argonema galeatum A003/A1]